jgi:uncharacterized protein
VKTIGLEEHFVTADVLQAWSRLEPQWQNPARLNADDDLARRLVDLDGERLAAMGDTGLDVQVLSLTSPGVQNVEPKDAVPLQIACNDLVADTVRAHPNQLQDFATLATTDPNGAARELERAVTTLGLNGALIFPHSRGESLDQREFWPIFEAATALAAPLYLHPQVPSPPVRPPTTAASTTRSTPAWSPTASAGTTTRASPCCASSSPASSTSFQICK